MSCSSRRSRHVRFPECYKYCVNVYFFLMDSGLIMLNPGLRILAGLDSCLSFTLSIGLIFAR